MRIRDYHQMSTWAVSKHEGVIRWAALNVRHKLYTLIARQLICLQKHHITDSSFKSTDRQAHWATN